MIANTTGTANVAVGTLALDANTTADSNTAVGYDSLGTNTTGAYNTALGYEALRLSTTSSNNTALGRQALAANTTGTENTAVGNEAGKNITTGPNNIVIGMQAGAHDIDLITGNQNVIIGDYSDTSASDSANQIVLGYNVTSTGNANLTFGNNTTDSNIAFGGTSVTAPSDIRLKEDIQDEKVGLDFINDLRPVTFLWKKEKDIPSDMKAHKADSETRTMNGKYNHGFIAQEVKEVIDNHNLKEGFEMWQEDETDGRQRLGEAALMSVMVKAVQELSAQIEELKTQPKCKCNEE